MNNLVTTTWLEKNLENVRILDASWHMPNMKRDGFKEFSKKHIPNSLSPFKKPISNSIKRRLVKKKTYS